MRGRPQSRASLPGCVCWLPYIGNAAGLAAQLISSCGTNLLAALVSPKISSNAVVQFVIPDPLVRSNIQQSKLGVVCSVNSYVYKYTCRSTGFRLRRRPSAGTRGCHMVIAIRLCYNSIWYVREGMRVSATRVAYAQILLISRQNHLTLVILDVLGGNAGTCILVDCLRHRIRFPPPPTVCPDRQGYSSRSCGQAPLLSEAGQREE